MRGSRVCDEAARARVIGPAQTLQLRDALKRQREAFEINRFVKLAQARLQQDRFVEPANDSAAFYLERARHAGASDQDLSETAAALLHRVLESARAAIDQRRFADAERWIAEARGEGAGSASLAAMQRDLSNARNLESREKADSQAMNLPRTAEAVHATPRSNATDGAADRTPADVPQPAPNPADAVQDVPLVLTKPIRPVYPSSAALKGVEGWVELTFTVAADGRVVNPRVTAANPAGVFDNAALRAVQAARYQALSRSDPSISRQAKLKLAFRLTK